MKKLLLATAAFALLAPAAHAEIKLDLGGYFKGYAGYSDQDVGGLRKFDVKRKSQVYFTGETTLDNGLTVGYNGQLMQENNLDSGASDAKTEQSYLYFSGNWGRVNMGRENGAAYLLQVSAPSADANIDGMDADFSFYNRVGNVREDYKQAGPRAGGVDNRDQQYSDKVTYLTPKFNGFQAGVSYSPSYQTNVNSYAVGGTTQPGYFGMVANGNAGELDNMWEGAARWDGEFSGVGIHAGAGYTHASSENGAALAGTAFGSDSFKQYNGGLKLTWDAFGLGANYIHDNGAADTHGDNRTWVVGGDYTWGAYNFGVSYLDSKGEAGATAGDDRLKRWTLGAGYTFGPGMKFNGSVGFYNGDAAGAAADNDATVATIGTDVQF